MPRDVRNTGRKLAQAGMIARAVECSLRLPLALARVPAGFPSPAEDYLEESLDVGRLLVKRPKTTFFMRVVGDSMTGAGIHDGDLLVVDRAERGADGAIVVARLDDDFCVKRLRLIEGRVWLYPENPNYQPIEITEGSEFEVWGRVTYAITELRQQGGAGPVIQRIESKAGRKARPR